MLVGSVLQQVHLQRNCEGWHLPEAAEKVVCNPIRNHLLPKRYLRGLRAHLPQLTQ